LIEGEEINTKKEHLAIIKWIKENPLDTVFLFLVLVFVIAVLFQRLILGWTAWQPWTGFGETMVEDGSSTPAKTLWDWMGLLVIPLGVAYIASRFTKTMKNNELKIAEQRSKREQEISLDQQRENALQSYFNRITELLLHGNGALINSSSDDEIRIVALSRTLSTIRMLDPSRKGILLSFLYEAGLILGNDPIIPLNKTNMAGVDLSGANLSGASLERVDLQGVDLRGADLSNVDFEGAILSGANLREANLSRAFLVETRLDHTNMTKANLEEADLNSAFLLNANLSEANLRKSYLFRAFLRGANLKGADLTGANLNVENFWAADLSDAKLDDAVFSKETSRLEVIFEDAIMPDGKKYDPEKHKFAKVSK